MIKNVNGILTINLLDDFSEMEPVKTKRGLLWGDYTTRGYLAAYYDILPEGEPYCLGNDNGCYDCSYNGGEYYYTVSDYAIEKLENGENYTFYPLDNSYIEEYISKCEG